MSEFATIAVPYDFSEHSSAALECAAGLARKFGSEIHLVHVIQPPAMAFAAYGAPGIPPADTVDMMQLREIATSALDDVARSLEGRCAGVQTHVVEGAGIAEAIREVAEKLSADLIAMGTHGRTGLAHAFLGSVAERTIRRAPCPVLTVQAPAKHDSGDHA